MKKYNSYKDSGIEWIGEIPSHWEVKRFGHLFSFSRGLGITKKDLKEEGIPCVNYGEIHSKFGFSVDPENHKLKCVEESYLETADKSLLKRGDFVFADTSEDIEGSGNFTVLDSDLPTFAGYHTVIARHENGNHYKYLAYCFDSLEFRNQIRSAVSGIKVFSITQAILKSSKVQLPSYPEQTAIATYLDRKTAEIDELIADKKRLLELYEEEKTAIINQAVTKGINPDVPMRDSGIEWLGEIPEHWEVKRLKFVASINDEVLTEKTEEDYEIEYVEISGVKSGLGIVETSNYIFKDAPSRARRIVRDGDVLVSTVRTYIKSIAKVENPKDNLIASTGFAVVRPREIDSDYSGFLFYSEPLIGEIISLSTGVSYPAINSSQIGDISIPIPPIEEQQSIAKQIDAESQRIDLQVERTKKLIELLKEYREALISEVVTGKVKVID